MLSKIFDTFLLSIIPFYVASASTAATATTTLSLQLIINNNSSLFWARILISDSTSANDNMKMTKKKL
jgi:hypothetical protein